MTEPALWTPTPSQQRATRLAAFAEAVGHDVATAAGYDALHAWSIEQPDAFWRALWRECSVVGDVDLEAPIVAGATDMPATRFFPNAQLSVVENLLARRGDGEAFVAIDELGQRRSLSWDELRLRTSAVAGALAALGVGPGDRVVAWLPNSIEVVLTMLGAASLGAVFSSSSPDFGTQGVLDRFGQIEPVVLVATDGYHYGGKQFDCLERLADIRAALPTLRATVVVDAVGAPVPEGCLAWADFEANGAKQPVAPQRFAFDHPWYVLFSSGTTGVPKCIVHRTGGVLVQHLKEHQLHCDIRPGDRVCYFTTTGWMMWNWLVSTLASGATAIAYDGSPFHPPTVLFDLAEREHLTLLGLSAKFIDTVRKSALRPIDTHDLSALRTICSTGSPLSHEGFAYVYDAIARDVHLASISGGTDLCGCFLGGVPTLPVHAGELQRAALAMATDVWDDEGRTLRDRPGVAGELVCDRPFPSMPLGFWGDGAAGVPDPTNPGPRYRSAYYERFAGVWAQGDFASYTEHHGVIIHGRSDATLNPGGVRIGTAEIYRAVEALPDVLESLAFAQQWQSDVRVVLLVRLAEGVALDDALQARIRAQVRAACTPRHVPAVIAQVDDLPRTRSNKLVELAVADAVNGRPVRNTEALANPEALTAIAALEVLRR